jgi:putative colanic acid biosynthesis UDP-glucose lipid carrier transferase
LDSLPRGARPWNFGGSATVAPPTAAEPSSVFILKSLLGPTVAVVSLLISLQLCGESFDGTYFLLAVLSFLASNDLLEPLSFGAEMHDRHGWWALVEIGLRWALIVGFLWALLRIAGLSERVHPRTLTLWIFLTPLCLWFAQRLARACLEQFGAAALPTRRAVIVGLTAAGVRLERELGCDPLLGTEVLGFFEDRSNTRAPVEHRGRVLGKLAELPEFVLRNDVSIVYITLPMTHHPRVLQVLDALRDSTASVYFVPDLFAFDLIQPRFDQINRIPVVAIRDTPLHGLHGIVKRLTDILLSLAIVTLTAPLLLAIAIGVRVTSPGPVLFKQRRYGLDGKAITVYKFRSMTVMEDGESSYTQVTRRDARVTAFGAFLRKSSLDELPQFFNVLQGTMSIVGPRPHAVAVNEQYRRLIPGYMIRHKVKPGITGWAQVNGHRGGDDLECMRKRIEFDLDYVQNWSLGLDLMIILRTAAVVWADQRAY